MGLMKIQLYIIDGLELYRTRGLNLMKIQLYIIDGLKLYRTRGLNIYRTEGFDWLTHI